MTQEELDLDTLWRSQTPAVDTDEVLRHVQSERRSQHWLDLSYAAVMLLSLGLTGYLELVGAFRLPGLLFALVAGSGIAYAWRRVGERRRLPQSAALAPRRMLEFALRQARRTHTIARALYTVLPAGVAAGYLAGPLLSDGASEFSRPLWLKVLMVGGAVAVLCVVIVAGLRIARAARRRIDVLSRRLDEFDRDL